MTGAHEPPLARIPAPGEQWSLADAGKLQEVFRLLAIPPLGEFTPAAVTAVGVLVSPSGDVAYYPVYAQVISAETDLSEPTEVRVAIAILRRWLRAQ